MRIVTAGQDVVPSEFARAFQILEASGHHRGRYWQRRAAAILARDPEFIGPIAVAPDLDHRFAKRGLRVCLPYAARFDDMAIRIDYLRHGDFRCDRSERRHASESQARDFITDDHAIAKTDFTKGMAGATAQTC